MKRSVFISKKNLLITATLFFCIALHAQTKNEHSGWIFFLNSTRFSPKWGLHFDAQLRSTDGWKKSRNLLVRPGITYYITPRQNATVGYLLAQTYIHSTDNVQTVNEHRLWEQYIIAHPLLSGSLSHRFRVEQRFIERTDKSHVFAQRFRYFVRQVQPLWAASGKSFTKGPFIAAQNEIFFNLQNKNQLNGNIFDQNRAYIAAGARLSATFDVEAGYMNQYIKGSSSNTAHHIAQVAVYTRF